MNLAHPVVHLPLFYFLQSTANTALITVSLDCGALEYLAINLCFAGREGKETFK